MMLVLEAMAIGQFAALDVFLFYVLFEAMLIPIYFLIGRFGGPQRQYAAVKFLLYNLLGGLLMLAARRLALLRGPGRREGLPAPNLVGHDFGPEHRALDVPRLHGRVRDQGAAVAVPHLAAGRRWPRPRRATRCCCPAVLDKVGVFAMLHLVPAAVPRGRRAGSRRRSSCSP